MLKAGKPKIIVILGPTATGKSDLAVFIAHKIGGEVISADSRQVYTGLDLGTGKITKKEMRKIPHYLLDVANAKKKFSVSEYKKLADQKIKEIISRNKVPIICGGTGFYIDAVVNDINFPEVPPNEKLRASLNKKTVSQLFEMLKKLDKARSKNIDKNNKVRLIRAIEIAKTLGKVPKISNLKNKQDQKYEFIKIGLNIPLDLLKARIEKRLNNRIKAGMLKEISNLHKNGLSWKRMEELGLEYRYTALYLQKKLTKQEYLEKLNTEIYKYAKRQITWFKRDKEIRWFDPTKLTNLDKTFSFLNNRS
jgi:tRNA dimethylallyltransferase